jgi:restriction system protein
LASDQIRKFLARKFKGHELARLVECLLRAQGYVTLASPPGPDGGVDILAGKGPLGFEEPNLCVQVKSGSPADVDTLRKLQGTMTTYKARQGLLVSWNGFNQRVLSEGKLSFFMVRFWDADDVIRAIFDTYEKLSDELRAELPLKRVWALVLDEAKFSDAVADK